MNRLKIVTGVILVFILGAVTGAVTTKVYVKYKFGQFIKAGPPPVKGVIMRRLSRLDLTEEQHEEIEKIVADMQVKFIDFREKHQPELSVVFDQAFEQIRDILNAEQRKKFEKIKERLVRPGKGFQKGRHKFQKKKIEKVLNDMDELLQLNEEQKADTFNILKDDFKKRRETIRRLWKKDIHDEAVVKQEMEKLEKSLEDRLSIVLTEAQIKDFKKFRKAHRPEMFPPRFFSNP
ncbi:MAG: hypothetical protein HN737_05775 [Desulfobacterales bacterium]|nr:hypothetical protein [Desulfobacteraceae bacterium]MBT4364765.1 hypothetical protein [Desulfobacteraceae bacterium]MBT7085933.1 hypothetical protein [Desulfobacterales bacterium]MBT7696899.1 hypothetical protein [Desulfobacterales bacterium]